MAITQDAVTQKDLLARLRARFAVHRPVQKSLPLLEWGRKYLSIYYSSKPSRMHEWFEDACKQLDDRGQHIAAIGPRGGAKSVVITLTAVLQRAVEGKETNILICSDTASQAIEHLRNLKDELESNDLLMQDYPNACGIGPIWKENSIQMRNGVRIRAVGTLSRIRGLRKRHIRPSLIVIDDPENDEHISSTEMRSRTRTWFRRTLMHMGDKKTNVIAIGTAIHREGLINHILRLPGWKTFRHEGRPAPFRSIIRMPSRMDLWDKWESFYYDVDDPKHLRRARHFYEKNRLEMKKDAKVIWPSRESLLYLMKLRAQLGHQAFEGEKQGNPINLETVEWPESYFEDIWFYEWPDVDMLRVIAADPSKGRDARRGDYSSIIKLGVTGRGVYYVEADLERRSTDKIVSDVIEALRTFGAKDLGFETNQFQSLLADEIAREMEHRDVYAKIWPLDNRVKKEVRIRRLSPLLAQHRIKFKARSVGTVLLVQQLKDFPNGDHDDGPDGLEMATRIAAEILEDDQPVDDV